MCNLFTDADNKADWWYKPQKKKTIEKQTYNPRKLKACKAHGY